MKQITEIKQVVLGGSIALEQLVAVARFGAQIGFSQDYTQRVNHSRALVERWIEEGRVMYGVTTGFGALCTQAIGKEDTAQLQENIILCCVRRRAAKRGTGTGDHVHGAAKSGAGVRRRPAGGAGAVPAIFESGSHALGPRDGSVGYLAPEAHIALVLLGRGKAYYQGELLTGAQALDRAGLSPMALSSKEGLALVSGTTSAAALASLALYDLEQADRASSKKAGTVTFRTPCRCGASPSSSALQRRRWPTPGQPLRLS